MDSYQQIAQRKQAHLAAQIPPEWRLSPAHIPAGMLSPAESVTDVQSYGRVNVMDVPRTCGLLSSHELDITEKYDIRGLMGEIAGGKLTCEEVVGAFCKRASIAHQLTRCLTEPLFDRALTRAQHLDAHLRRTSTPIGPLHGLPITLKDTFNITGVDSSLGLAALAFQPASADAPLVTLLESLGAIIIAKTNVPQTMGALDTANHLFGRTLNPLNRQLTVGGSTGGEAALLALRGSMAGFGSDIGGSIRIPAMCAGIYGFKPSVGRVPFAGQQMGQPAGKDRISLQTVAGPLARSVADLDALMREIVPRAELFAEDCIPGVWPSPSPSPQPSGKKFKIGILRGDGIVAPLPPIARVVDEVATALRRTPGVEVVEVPVPKALTRCQTVAGRLMGIDGGNTMMDILERTGEPLIPWLQKRMKRGKPLTVAQLAELQAQRGVLERDLHRSLWEVGQAGEGRIDALIHPVAPHPVPQLDRYNAVGYTSSWVLLDYPAGSVPVRRFGEADLEGEVEGPVGGSWDKANRGLWNEKTVDRRVYLDSPLSVQVITPRQHDHELMRAMEIVDQAVHVEGRETKL
ncbi:fatty-acid amide hydrolase [Aspergillus campestris IBT 28561]|uniref:Fatty-acid amide hydrolase n=1 Tax=Aspergillus campestris (strain IBT 28561) TaxID=1392248 RepID=A0A2I1DFH0_ASPC2|nr:fatty-acid amide hydrolase [Aspergillus campestris IBT 28561]PKY08623.1 fatty-acid amide hydrolase [Aspergillus campestris IBT 28561]